MAKCPGCGAETGSPIKEWHYGPKKRKGPLFHVEEFTCPSCGLKFRNYIKDGQVKFTLALKEGKFKRM